MSVEPNRARLDLIRAMIQRGQIVPVIDSVLSLQDAASAHRQLEVGGVLGKRSSVPGQPRNTSPFRPHLLRDFSRVVMPVTFRRPAA